MTATQWMEEVVYQIEATYEDMDRGNSKFTAWESAVMRMVLHDKLSKNYEVEKTWEVKEVA